MARERAKLTEKQERILIQCQLMGLTPRDMQQISNRLIALQKEREYKDEVAAAVDGLSWAKTKNGWQITDSHGKVFECVKKSKSNRGYYDRGYSWDVTIGKPGTRFKTKVIRDVGFYVNPYITGKLCPENSKDLLALLSGIQKGRIS